MKKAVSMVLVILLLAGSFTAFARAENCDFCGIPLIKVNTYYTTWKTVDLVRCPINPLYNDKVQVRVKVVEMRCPNCGSGVDYETSETQTVCGHSAP